MTAENQICANCGHEKFNHPKTFVMQGHLKGYCLRCPCEKFVPVQSPEPSRNSDVKRTGANPVLRGIFDMADLPYVIRVNSKEDGIFIERQRLKAEVKKILMGFLEEQKSEQYIRRDGTPYLIYSFSQKRLEELKKRLGI